MAAIQDFFKENLKGQAANIAFLPGYVKEVGEAQSKMRALIKVTSDWLFWSLKALAPWRAALYGGWAILGFKALGDAIKSIVRDTGSLAAALQKLQSIQITQRQLAPFVGGMATAKQRVAELLTLSAKGPFKFEEIAAANVSLEKFTRGAYSSAQATQAVGQAAIATGNDIGQVADAVGEFYQNLRAGAPIESAAENLRQLGIISQQSANELVSMSQAGAATSQIFNRLTSEVEHTSKTVKGMGDSIAGVNAEYAKAVQNMQEKFGAPWTEKEVQNTKNMTAAMQALAPTIGRISEGWSKLFSGFTTVGTALTKMAAQNKFVRDGLENLVTVFNSLLTAAMAVATVGIPFLIPKLFGLIDSLLGAQRAASGLGIGLKMLGAAGAIGLAVTGAVMLTGAIMNEVHAHREVNREIERQRQAFEKSNKAIKEQIANSKTLAEHQDAIANAMNQVISAHQQLIDIQEKGKETQRTFWDRALDPSLQGRMKDVQEWWDKMHGGSRQEKAAMERERVARETLEAGIRERGAALTGPGLERLMEQRRGARFTEEQRRYEAQMAREPGRAPELEEERAGTLMRRGAAGARGLNERAMVERRTAGLSEERMLAQARKETAQASLDAETRSGGISDKRKKDLEDEIKASEALMRQKDAAMLKERLNADKTTSIQKSAQAEQLRLAIAAGAAQAAGRTQEAVKLKELAGGQIAVTADQRERAKATAIMLDDEAKILAMYEEQSAQLIDQGQAMKDNAALRRREQAVERQTADIELARRIAQREGRGTEAVSLKNQEAFIDRYESYRKSLPEAEARQRAMAETAEDIRERVIPGGPAAVVSSLQEIGGGGGIYAPGGDPAEQTRKLIAKLVADSNSYLKIISTKGEGVK
jgi:hypothetical protein